MNQSATQNRHTDPNPDTMASAALSISNHTDAINARGEEPSITKFDMNSEPVSENRCCYCCGNCAPETEFVRENNFQIQNSTFFSFGLRHYWAEYYHKHNNYWNNDQNNQNQNNNNDDTDKDKGIAEDCCCKETHNNNSNSSSRSTQQVSATSPTTSTEINTKSQAPRAALTKTVTVTQTHLPLLLTSEGKRMNSTLKLSREARRRNQLHVDSLVDGNIKASVGTRRVQEILQRCSYLASKKGQDLHALRKSLKDDEEKAASEKIARRLSAYFASLGNVGCGGGGKVASSGVGGGSDAGHSPGCSCYRIADWPVLDPDIMLIDHDSDSDDLADELYSTVYLGGTSDWANKLGMDYNNSSQSSMGHFTGDNSRRAIHTGYQIP